MALLKLPPARKAPTPIEKAERQERVKERPSKISSKDLAKEAAKESAKEQVKAPAVKAVEAVAAKSKDTPKITARRVDAPTATAKTNGVASKTGEKRARPEDDNTLQVPSKRPKPLQDGQSTPSQQVITSPALSNKSSAQKSQTAYATPRKDLKALNMLRSNSMESHDSTPGRSGSTPATSKQDGKVPPTSAPGSVRKQAEMQALAKCSQRLNIMGRSLKHEAQKIITEKGGKLSTEDQKRVAMLSIECILSYMAAYQAQDQANIARGRSGEVEATWKTLLPLCQSYASRTKDFAHLDGLRLHLNAVIAAAVCGNVVQRANRPNAHDSPQGEPQPQVARTPSVSDNFALISEHYMQQLRFAQDARVALPLDDLQKVYPKTWAGKECDAKLAKVTEKFPAGNLSGPYFLPIQADTSPIQAVRFGLKLLSEYSSKEKLGHALKVNLEKPE